MWVSKRATVISNSDLQHRPVIMNGTAKLLKNGTHALFKRPGS